MKSYYVIVITSIDYEGSTVWTYADIKALTPGEAKDVAVATVYASDVYIGSLDEVLVFENGPCASWEPEFNEAARKFELIEQK